MKRVLHIHRSAGRVPAAGVATLGRPRALRLDGKTSGAPAQIAAASGLALVGNHLWVVADDEHFVACFALGDSQPGRAVRVFPGDLPAEVEARKAKKPDLEVLLSLPGAMVGVRGQALLAIPSGSRHHRTRGVVLGVSTAGAVLTPPRDVSFAPLFHRLRKLLPALNIEGAVVIGDVLRLIQRGNGKGHVNALIDLDLAAVVAALTSGRPVPDFALRQIHRVELGSHGGVPIGFTDAAALPDGRIVFIAAAEASKDAVQDGPVVFSGVGILGRDGRLERLVPFAPTIKMEGVHARLTQTGKLELLLVSDADDRSKPAGLYRVSLTL